MTTSQISKISTNPISENVGDLLAQPPLCRRPCPHDARINHSSKKLDKRRSTAISQPVTEVQQVFKKLLQTDVFALLLMHTDH